MNAKVLWENREVSSFSRLYALFFILIILFFISLKSIIYLASDITAVSWINDIVRKEFVSDVGLKFFVLGLLPEIPYWIKFKREKNGIVIYNIRKNLFYRSNSLLLYLILKMLSKNYSVEQIVEIISEDNKISFLKAKEKVDHYLTQLQKIIIGENREGNNTNYNNIDHVYEFESPLVLSLLLTYKCNLKCKHCLVGSLRHYQIKELELDDIKKLAEQMEKYEIFKIILNGGEPTVRKDFFKILEIFNKHKIPIELVTNGINLSKEKIEIMNSYHVVGYSLSIEGSNSETHDFIRGEGTFKKVISSISNLKKFSNAFQVDVEVTYGKHNMMQIEEIVKLLSDLGVTSVKFARLKPWDWGQQLSNIVPNKEEIKKVNEKIWNIEGKYKGIKIMGDVPKSIEDQKVPGCNINVGFEIQPDGNVLPCRIFEQRVDDKIILGNIKSQDIFEIWNSEKAKRIRSYSKRLSKRFLCTKCEFARFCSTNYCIAENFIKFGKFIPSEEDLNKCKI